MKVGYDICWLVFIKCPPDIPSNSPLRESLRNPTAQSKATNRLFGLEWKQRVPYIKDFVFQFERLV